MKIFEPRFTESSPNKADQTPKKGRHTLELSLAATLFMLGCSSESQTRGAAQQVNTAMQEQEIPARPSPTIKPMQQMKNDFMSFQKNVKETNKLGKEIGELRRQRIKNVNAKKRQN